MKTITQGDGGPRGTLQTLDEADEAMARYSRGDAAAFALVYDAVCRDIAALLRRRIRNAATVEDLVQETFVKMHKHRATFLPGSRVRPWAAAIALRLCIDHYRRATGAERVFSAEPAI